MIHSDSSMQAGTVTFKATAQDRGKKSASVQVKFGAFADRVTIGNYDENGQFVDMDQYNESIILPYNTSIYLDAQVLAKDDTQNVSTVGVTWGLKDAADKNAVTLKTEKNGMAKVTAKNIYKQFEEITLVATSKDGMASDEITITVLPKDPTQINIWRVGGEAEATNVTRETVVVDLNSDERTVTLQAVASPELTGVTWSPSKSSKTANVTVNEDGTFTVEMLKAGSVTVTAKSGKKSATVTIKATKLAEGLEIYEKTTRATEGLRLASGKSLELKAAVSNASSSKVTWSIPDKTHTQYASINSAGKLTAAKDLTVRQTITVQALAQDGSEAMDTIDVTIYPLAQGVQMYSESNEDVMTFSIDGNDRVRSNTTFLWDMAQMDSEGNPINKIKLSAFVYPYYGDNNELNAMQDITWKSSNTKIARFVTDENGQIVDDNGKIQLECLNPGTVTITASAKDGSGKKVSVKLKIVCQVQNLDLKDSAPVNEDGYIEVVGGKSLDLSKLVQIDPGSATNKKLNWKIDKTSNGRFFALLSSSGKLTTRKVTAEKYLTIDITPQDGSSANLQIRVKIVPQK